MHLRLLRYVSVFTGHLVHGIIGQPLSQFCNNGLTNAALQLSNETQIFFPKDSEFDDVTLRWTNYSRPTFSAAAIPALESDVQKLVRFASTCNIPFLMTSGDHGFSTTFGKLQRGLKINLSKLRSVSVDTAASTMTVGGGVRFSDVLDPVFAAGKETNHGALACVGLLSPTLGGGAGRYNGLHGTMGDQLLSARVVTANGSIVTASARESPDLYWALRGAGNNFGVVTQATYRIFDLTSRNVMNADFAFRPNASTAVIDWLASFGDNTPAKLAIILFGVYDPTVQDLSLVLNVIYAGPESEFTPYLAPLLNATTPYRQSISSTQWNRILYESFFGATPTPEAACAGKGANHSVYGGAVKTYHRTSWSKFITSFSSLLRTTPDARGSVFFIEQFSKVKVLQIPNEEAAFPWRDITGHVLWNYSWTKGETLGVIEKFGRYWRDEFLKGEVSGLKEKQIYVNYGHGDEKPEVLYGKAKLGRLRQLKGRWDPWNRFGWYNSFV